MKWDNPFHRHLIAKWFKSEPDDGVKGGRLFGGR